MLYPELFKQFEALRWDLERDIPWPDFQADKLSDEQALTIKMNAITEWAALPATEMFLRDNRDDSDFCAFMSVWFYEEQKHSLVLMEYLRRFRPDLLPTEEELHTQALSESDGPSMKPWIELQPVGSSEGAAPTVMQAPDSVEPPAASSDKFGKLPRPGRRHACS